MKIISRRWLASQAAARWKQTYYRESEGGWRESVGGGREITHIQLLALGPEPEPSEVNRIIGNDSWTGVMCNECRGYPEFAVEVGEELDFASSTAQLCMDCLNKAVAMAVIESEGNAKPVAKPLALDVSLEKARALHRVWRALNDGDCPGCHEYHQATEMHRTFADFEGNHISGIMCPTCYFCVTTVEIQAIEKMFAPAMDAAKAIFDEWREERNTKQ